MTKIEWTDVTDNIIVAEGGGWWCRKSSPACDNCYAERLNLSKYFGGNLREYKGQAPPLKLRRDIIESWPRQRKPKKHFVMSMSDVFGPWVPREWQFEMLNGMLTASLQTFQVLSKWSRLMWPCVLEWLAGKKIPTPRNIWLGFTAENQEWFNHRWPFMRNLAHGLGFTIFVSIEPMLGPVRLPDDFLALGDRAQVIVGGESGPDARQMNVEWVRSIIEQCRAASVPCFVKQLGKYPVDMRSGEPEVPPYEFFLSHSKGGDPSEWPEDLRVRQFPSA